MPISNVFNCDCVEFMRTLPDNYFDLACSDPPYGDAVTADETTPPTRYGDGRATAASGAGSTSTVAEVRRMLQPLQAAITPPKFTKIHTAGGTWARRYAPFCESRTGDEETKVKYGSIDWDVAPSQEYWDELFRVSKNQIIWGGNYFCLPPTRCFVVWRKLSISEKFSMAMAEYAWTSFNENAKVFEAAPQGNAREPRIHACQKPVALYQFLLKHFAKEGDKIFDSHMGSQSSRIAAWNMGFDYWGCELNETYFRQGCERFERVCHGVQKTRDGGTVTQLSLF